MTQEIGRRLVGGVWVTNVVDEPGGGGSLPDPSGEPDGDVLTVASGAAVWSPGGGSQPGTVRMLDLGIVDATLLADDSDVLYTPADGEIVGPVMLRDVVPTDSSTAVVIGRDEQVPGEQTSPALAAWGDADVFDSYRFANEGSVPVPTTTGAVRAGLSSDGSSSGMAASRWRPLRAYRENEAVVMEGHIWYASPGGTSAVVAPDFAANIGGTVQDGEAEAAASTVIAGDCDLRFTAQTPGSGGNDITVELAMPTEDTEDTTVTVDGNAIRVGLAGIAATPGVKAAAETAYAGANNDLVIRASVPSASYNGRTIAITDAGGGNLSIQYFNHVPFTTDGNTAAAVIAAINTAFGGYPIDAEAAPGNDGSGVIVPTPVTGDTWTMTGGVTLTGATHTSTAAEVIAAIEDDMDAAALVSVEIANGGDGADLSARSVATHLAGGGLLVWNDNAYALPTFGSAHVYAYVTTPVAP